MHGIRAARPAFLFAWLIVLGVLAAGTGTAASPEPPAPPPQATPAEAAWEAAANALLRGPQTIALRDEGTLALPEGYGFVPLKEAATLMEALGNATGGSFIGLIFPIGKQDEQWIVSVDYDAAGYIRDDEARHWQADALLENLREGTRAGNERRARLGIPALEVTRWIEAPRYDAGTQRLAWSAEARETGAPPGADPTVNYNTYLLGREGYFALNLITSASRVESEKPAAQTLLSAVSFNPGKRYADFDSTTDKVAAYGLAALVGGIAVKKLGLLALAGAFLLKFLKLIVVAVMGGAAFVAKLLGAKKA